MYVLHKGVCNACVCTVYLTIMCDVWLYVMWWLCQYCLADSYVLTNVMPKYIFYMFWLQLVDICDACVCIVCLRYVWICDAGVCTFKLLTTVIATSLISHHTIWAWHYTPRINFWWKLPVRGGVKKYNLTMLKGLNASASKSFFFNLLYF